MKKLSRMKRILVTLTIIILVSFAPIVFISFVNDWNDRSLIKYTYGIVQTVFVLLIIDIVIRINKNRGSLLEFIINKGFYF